MKIDRFSEFQCASILELSVFAVVVAVEEEYCFLFLEDAIAASSPFSYFLLSLPVEVLADIRQERHMNSKLIARRRATCGEVTFKDHDPQGKNSGS